MAWYSGYQHPYRGFSWTWAAEKNHSGIDLPDSCGTPMTAILPGKVIIAGQYPCYGGQVSIQSKFAGQDIVYTYLHGQSHSVGVGDTVHPGQVVGYSGAPLASQCGGGCHIHFEVEHGTQAPYTGGPPQNSNANNYPIDPVPLLVYAVTGKISGGGASQPPPPSSPGGSTTDLADKKGASGSPCTIPLNPFDNAAWALYWTCVAAQTGSTNPVTVFSATLGQIWSAIGPWLTDPTRILKLVTGVVLVGISLVALILPTAAPIAAAGGAVALGAPELAGPAAAAASSVFKKPGTPPAPRLSVAQGVSGYIGARGERQQKQAQQNQVQVNRSYTTRNLGGNAPQAAPPTQPLQAAPVTKPIAPQFAPQFAPSVAGNYPAGQGRVVLGPNYKPNPTPPQPKPPTPKKQFAGRLGGPGTSIASNPTPPGTVPKSVPVLTVQRGPKTGLGSTISSRYGATTTVTHEPIPDVQHEQTIRHIQASKTTRVPRSQRTRQGQTPEERALESALRKRAAGVKIVDLTKAEQTALKRQQAPKKLGGSTDVDKWLDEFRKATGQE